MIHPKVKAVGATGSLATVVVAILAAFGVTGPIAAVVSAVVTILVFAAGYFKSGPAVVATVTGDVTDVEPLVEQLAPYIEAAVEKAIAAHSTTPVVVTPIASTPPAAPSA